MKPADPERLRRVNALLEVALALPLGERDAWLAALPADDHEVVPALRALLARAAVETDTFMRRPLALGLDDLGALGEPEQAGDRIGPYRLVRELGAGGMATVWLAERVDGALQRQVALKLPRAAWALGLARRMARERDILATLEHPRIARLYDAGVTDAGRPWLAMECVSGVPIDVFCSEQQLDVQSRLRLFLQVADAVAHAHARLVVHRDLKPSNILVTAEGEVRLLDFGVAKLIEEDVPPAANLTQLIGRAVTPDYASPEQVLGEPVTVATDVYSLGVVLYELLAGQRPYRLGRASAAELEEAILSVSVPLASTQVDDRKLARQLRGDLDNVLAKAMRKDASRRYTSVEAMAADVQRFLDGEPVQAERRSRWYRFGKFARRNRLPLAAGGAVAVALLVGLGAALWQAREARAEAARAEQVKRFVASIFEQAKPREGQGGAVTAAELLASAAERVETELATQPRVAAELGVMVGQGFSALGEPRRGQTVLRAAVIRAERVHGPRHLLTVHAKMLLAESLNTQDPAAAERLMADLVPGLIAGLPAMAREAVEALSQQSFVIAKRNDAAASYAPLRQAVAIGTQHLGAEHAETIQALGLLSNTYGRFGERALQLEAATEAHRRAQSAFGAQRPSGRLTQIERWYGEALRANDRPADAVPILHQVLADQRVLDAAETPRVGHAIVQLASALDLMGRTHEALPLMRAVVALEAAQNPVDSDDRIAMLGHLANLLTVARRADEAWPLHERAVGLRQALAPSSEIALAVDGVRRSRLLAMRGDAAGAAQAAAGVIERAGAAQPAIAAEGWLSAAFNERLQGRPTLALEAAQRAARVPGLRLATRAVAAAEVGVAWLDAGDALRAGEALQQARGLYAQAQVEPSVRMATALVGQARLHLQDGRAAEAEKLLTPLAKAWEEVHPQSEWHGETLYWLALAEARAGKAEAARLHHQRAVAMLERSRLPSLRALASSTTR